MDRGKGKSRRGFTRLYEHGRHDDIRYRGPLTHQSFLILGWLCIVASAAAMMVNLGIRINPEMKNQLARTADLMETFADLALPLLLISNFARILGNDEGYGQQLWRNGVAALGVFAAFNLAFGHFLVGSLKLVSAKPDEVMPLVMETFHDANSSGFTAFNLFVDLFLCTLFMFFLNYRPRRVFVGKWVIAFRLLAVLPVGYEVASILLRAASATGRIALPVWSFALLTVKPPIAFLVFMLMALFIKAREWRYCSNGNTPADYEAFLQTNRNSLHISLFMALLLAVAGIVDFSLMLYVMNPDKVMNRLTFGIAAGIGESTPLLFVAPLMPLLSYTRRPWLKDVDLLIPVAGVLLALLVVLQGGYQILAVSKVPPIDLREVKSLLEQLAVMMKLR